MTKIQVLDSNGKKVKEIEGKIFDGKIREDIVAKIVESEKMAQEYGVYFLAGMQTSASGNVRHLRHSWKSDRGRGMSRVPKKRMSRRGDRFHWVAAVAPNTRGGRKSHAPVVGKRLKKINKKELLLGLKSALAMIADLSLVKKKYARLENKELDLKLPLVIEAKVLESKTKDLLSRLKKISAGAEEVVLQKKNVRAGRGTMRNRKYKKSAGLLLVLGNKEKKKLQGVDVLNAQDLSVTDIASNGARLCIFTEQAIIDLEERLKNKKKIDEGKKK